MRRYYFDLKSSSEEILDKDGVQAAQFDQVLTQAHEVITEILNEHPEWVTGGWALNIRDDDGLVAMLPIRAHAQGETEAAQSEGDAAAAVQRLLARIPVVGSA